MVLFNKVGVELNNRQHQMKSMSCSLKRPHINFHLKYNVPEQVLVPPVQQVFVEEQNFNKSDILLNSIIGVNTKHLSLKKEKTSHNNNELKAIEGDYDEKRQRNANEEEIVTSIVPAPNGTWWLPNFCFGAISATEPGSAMNRTEEERSSSFSINKIKFKDKRKIRHMKEINEKIKDVLKNNKFRLDLRKQIKSMSYNRRKVSVSRMKIEAKFLKIKSRFNFKKTKNETSVVKMKKMESIFSTGFPNLTFFSFPLATTRNEYYDPTKSCASLSDLDCCMWQQPMTLPPIVGPVRNNNGDAEILVYNYCRNWLWDYFLCFWRI